MHHNKIPSAITTRTWLMLSNQRSHIDDHNKAMITIISQHFLIYFLRKI